MAGKAPVVPSETTGLVFSWPAAQSALECDLPDGTRANFTFGELELEYLKRTTSRDAYQRAMETCQATKGWVERAARSG